MKNDGESPKVGKSESPEDRNRFTNELIRKPGSPPEKKLFTNEQVN